MCTGSQSRSLVGHGAGRGVTVSLIVCGTTWTVSVTLVHVCDGGLGYIEAWLVVLATVPVRRGGGGGARGVDENDRRGVVRAGLADADHDRHTERRQHQRCRDDSRCGGQRPGAGGACAVELGAAHDALLSVFAASSAALTCTSDQPGREGHFFGDFFSAASAQHVCCGRLANRR